ncbi:MAG: TlpA family protein disulfide reductase [Phycisphaerae bacterium]|nr:TlpA family protein disulfide reductase [Phycisphaerae bacterium]
MAIRWENKGILQAWPVYAVCLSLVGLLVWGSRHYPSQHRDKSLAEAIASSIRGHKAGGETMQDILDARRTWQPVLMDWYGRRATDWTFRDAAGVDRRLSDWHGRPVVLLYWATWSPASFMQAGHLDRLGREMGPDGPVVIACSEEAGEKLMTFAETHGVHFTMVSLRQAPPEPFCAPWVRETPTSFYIDAEGRIKLATEGVVPFFQAKAIIEAKE